MALNSRSAISNKAIYPRPFAKEKVLFFFSRTKSLFFDKNDTDIRTRNEKYESILHKKKKCTFYK